MKMNEIDNLIRTNEEACVSIVMPTDRINKKKNYENLKKCLQTAKTLLRDTRLSPEDRLALTLKIDNAIANVPETLEEGLGIFISSARYSVVTFPFEVKSTVTVNHTFEVRNLLYLKQYSIPYYVLNLSKKGVHLYKGILDELEEIRDEKFPLLYEDQFEYQRASIADSSSGSMKGFEKDKNEISEIRLKAVFRDADAFLKARMTGNAKLLLAGTQKMTSLFNSVTSLKPQIAGKVTGSYNDKNQQKMYDNAWRAVIKVKKAEVASQVRDLEEKNGHVAGGLKQAWSAAVEGRGLTLLVEKDLHHRAYRREDDNKLHLQPPRKPYTVVPDAVEDLIETVRAKNGKVVFTENDQLKEFDHLALVLRY